MDSQLSQHFNSKEFKCPCCGECKIETSLIEKLEEFRAFLGQPIKITSGYRCDAHNEVIGGAKLSQHKLGRAADIQVGTLSGPKLYRKAIEFGKFGGLGVGKNYLHVDVREVKAQWVYPGVDGSVLVTHAISSTS